ncbi:unnamed protein product [Porites lobata]|uniref:SAM domain-containing protein n=1 Tax=Porites lobata TaxID=104759 RepID=A0ABN8NEK5_9CNID|nr:unnamed protein product [Porites lobata]
MNEYSYFEKGCRQKSARDNPERQGTTSLAVPPAVPKRHSAPVPESTKTSKDPPPLPVKKSKPRTVEELMQRIGFSQYTSSLVDYGWDDLEFLGELNEQELNEAGVPEQHHKMILGAIKKFLS